MHPIVSAVYGQAGAIAITSEANLTESDAINKTVSGTFEFKGVDIISNALVYPFKQILTVVFLI